MAQKLKDSQKKLKTWYLKNHRKLPWRTHQDPYRIWISEVMLQQTTVKAVIPYYEKFLSRFPNVKSLAQSSLEDVYEHWAGLGYYSRARNLHKAAQVLAQTDFPKSHIELLALSGFGPYTARAVASFAFDDRVGVLDGNVIRFLSRYHKLKTRFWENTEKQKLQDLADEWVQGQKSSIINQALIEIGATICTPQNPSCMLCPLRETCGAYAAHLQHELPLKKPRKSLEIWVWEPEIIQQKSGAIALTKNEYAPFLKGQMIFPGQVYKSKTRPKDYHYKHTITHHSIYVRIKKQKTSSKASKDWQWIKIDQIKKVSPVSLIQKALKFI